MKRLLFATLIVASLLGSRPAAQSGYELFQQALSKEQAEGKLPEAIALYQRIAKNFTSDRALTVKALLRLAECYQKAGDTQARTVLEQVVRDYSDQKEAAATAREHLGAGLSMVRATGDRAVWTGSKVDLFGRVSPDGRYVTYVDWDLYGNLAVRDVSGNVDSLLTHKKSWGELDGATASWSAISPDNRQVAYGWQSKDPEIRVLPLAPTGAAEPRRLVKFSGDEVRFLGVRDWSRDGKWLAIGLDRKDGTSQIGIASVADGSFTVLKSTDWRGADRLAFSNDGKYLAYDLPASDETDQRDVFLLAVDGRRETRAVAHNANDLVVGWSPDGKYLLFSSDRTGSNALWAVNVVDGRPTGAPELLKADIGADSYPLGLTRRGALVVYKNISSRDVKIAGIDLNAGKLGQTVHFPQGYMAAPANPHWSPDSKSLVYQVRGGKDGLAVRSIDNGAGRRLPRKLLYARDPRWSPDGKSLIVGGRDGKGRDGIYQVDVDSGNSTPIVHQAQLDASPRWSADGTKIYYRDHKGPDRVLEHDLRSGTEREVFRHSSIQDIEVSPDGRTLAVQASDPSSQADRALPLVPSSQDDRALLLVSIADGSSRELLRLTSREAFPQLHTMAWTPDSRAILIVTRTSGQPELWAIDVLNGKRRQFDVDATDWKAAIPGTDAFLDGGFSLSPDGRHIAFLMGKRGAEVWALENFLPSPETNRQTARK
jgi:Tol biopolymer transport system component